MSRSGQIRIKIYNSVGLFLFFFFVRLHLAVRLGGEV